MTLRKDERELQTQQGGFRNMDLAEKDERLE